MDAEELNRLREEVAELHRLRAEVARLLREKENATQLAAQNTQLREALARFASAPEKQPEGQKSEREVLPLVQFEDMPIHDVIHALAHQANLNLVFDPEVAPQLDHFDSSLTLSIRLENLTAEEALRAILSTNNLRLVKTPGPTWKRSEDVATWPGNVVGITKK